MIAEIGAIKYSITGITECSLYLRTKNQKKKKPTAMENK